MKALCSHTDCLHVSMPQTPDVSELQQNTSTWMKLHIPESWVTLWKKSQQEAHGKGGMQESLPKHRLD